MGAHLSIWGFVRETFSSVGYNHILLEFEPASDIRVRFRASSIRQAQNPTHNSSTTDRSKVVPLLLLFITKTCLYSFDPLKPHFYIVKLGFTGVYIIFLISAQKHRLWYSLEPSRRGDSNEYPQSMLLSLTSTHNLCFEQK